METGTYTSVHKQAGMMTRLHSGDPALHSASCLALSSTFTQPLSHWDSHFCTFSPLTQGQTLHTQLHCHTYNLVQTSGHIQSLAYRASSSHTVSDRDTQSLTPSHTITQSQIQTWTHILPVLEPVTHCPPGTGTLVSHSHSQHHAQLAVMHS